MYDSVSFWITARIIRDYSRFMFNHNFKVSPSAKFVSNANAIYKDTYL
jgi:hypothetical protein